MVVDTITRRDEDPAPAHRRWYRRPRWIVLVIVATVLAAGAVPFAIRWAHRGAKEVSIASAVRNYGNGHPQASAGFLRPAPGVYTFAGSGAEKLSLLSTTQHWGPNIPVTVTDDTNGCWTFRVDYSTHHWQSVRYCPKGRALQQTGEATYQTFDFVAFSAGDTNEVVCRPPIDRIRVDAEPGARWHVACDGRSKSRGTKFHAEGTDAFVGIEKVRVGGALVPAYHYSVERTLTGSQSGVERYDMWYSVRDGLPLKTNRDVKVKSPSPIGSVIYTEKGTYALTALTPQS